MNESGFKKWIDFAAANNLTLGEKETLYNLNLTEKEETTLCTLCNYIFNLGQRTPSKAKSVQPRKEDLDNGQKKWLDGMTAKQRLALIRDICVDWDGYRTADKLGELINELWAYAAYPITREAATNPSHDKEWE